MLCYSAPGPNADRRRNALRRLDFNGSDGVFGRPPRSQHSVEALRFRLMIDVVCVEAATSIRWRSAA
jgi:hypothetical protein